MRCAPSPTDTPPIDRNPFADGAGEYPGAVAYYQQRRVYGGSDNLPQTIWMSQAGSFGNMSVSEPLRDDDAMRAAYHDNHRQYVERRWAALTPEHRDEILARGWRKFYLENAYYNAQVTWVLEENSETHTVVVRMMIQEGKPARIRYPRQKNFDSRIDFFSLSKIEEPEVLL